MANYSLVTDATFKPFTFDELVKPYLMYKQEYDKIEKDYNDLASQAEAFKDMANQEASPEAYAMYSKYTEDLNKATEDLQEGLSPMTRRNLMNLKKRYAGEITPIAAAATKVKEHNDLMAKAGPDAIFRVSKYTGVDAGLHGKELDNTYTSESAITKKAAGMSEAAMAELAQDPEYKKFLNDQAYLITQHTGGSYEDLMDAVNNNEQTQSRLAKIKQDIKSSLGYDKYDAEGQARIEDAINTGLYAGLDKPVRQLKENADHMTPYQSANLRMAQEEHNAKMQDRQPVYIAPPVYKTETVTENGTTKTVTTDEVDEEATRKNAYWLDPVTGLPFVKKDESRGTESSNRRYTTDVKPKAGSSSSGSSSSSSSGGGSTTRNTGLSTDEVLVIKDTGKTQKNDKGVDVHILKESTRSRKEMLENHELDKMQSVEYRNTPGYVQDTFKRRYPKAASEDYVFEVDKDGVYHIHRNTSFVENNVIVNPDLQ